MSIRFDNRLWGKSEIGRLFKRKYYVKVCNSSNSVLEISLIWALVLIKIQKCVLKAKKECWFASKILELIKDWLCKFIYQLQNYIFEDNGNLKLNGKYSKEIWLKH